MKGVSDIQVLISMAFHILNEVSSKTFITSSLITFEAGRTWFSSSSVKISSPPVSIFKVILGARVREKQHQEPKRRGITCLEQGPQPRTSATFQIYNLQSSSFLISNLMGFSLI